MEFPFHLAPIGTVRKNGEQAAIEIYDAFADGLLGLEGFSHIFVFYWFDRNDAPEKRQTLQVHPRGDRRNPLTGVFATHAPLRPNPIALTLCKIAAIAGNVIELEKIDAYDNSPVIDIKCYIPPAVEDKDVRQPDWVTKTREEEQ